SRRAGIDRVSGARRPRHDARGFRNSGAPAARRWWSDAKPVPDAVHRRYRRNGIERFGNPREFRLGRGDEWSAGPGALPVVRRFETPSARSTEFPSAHESRRFSEAPRRLATRGAARLVKPLQAINDLVAQICNLPYRGFAIRRARHIREILSLPRLAEC